VNTAVVTESSQTQTIATSTHHASASRKTIKNCMPTALSLANPVKVVVVT
jgi:hypothetical protein